MPAPEKKAFITGITGFVGKYLAELLTARDWSVFGFDRWPECGFPNVTYFEGEILDTSGLIQILGAIRPERIFHLAAVSFPSDADLSPRHALDINVMGTSTILDAVRQACPSSRLLLVGSSKQYSDAIVSDAITEEAACSPTSFYGISKYAAELLGLQYRRQYGMDVRFTRSFNHTGPEQSPRFVCSDWAKQVAGIELDKAEPALRVGDLSPAIDFLDVRDVVRAYDLILDKGIPGEVYNVSSGKATALGDILKMLTAKSSKRITVTQEDARFKAHKTSLKAVGDHTKLSRHTGWRPEIPIEKTLDDLYSFWLSQLQSVT